MSKGIFISYRRAGNGAGFALSLYEGLRPIVGNDRVFFDVSHGAIDIGRSWREAVGEAIGQCHTVLVLVDDLFDKNLNDPEDPLRIELEVALEIGVRIVPVYVGATTPPSKDNLPASLAILPELQASRIRLETSPADMQQVILDATGKHAANETKTSLSRLPVTGRAVFGRSDEIHRLNEAWESENTNLLMLVAWGGVGKSALINHWIRELGSDFGGAERVYAWSFFSQGTEGKATSGDVFIDNALTWFGDDDPSRGSAWEKGERLAHLVRARRTLLLLDGVEPLQYPPGPQEGQLRDPSIQALLRELAGSNTGLCVLSTRLSVHDLEEFVGSTVEQIDLDQLSPEAGAELLRALDVKGESSELQKASEEFEGHSLALTLLGSYLGDVFDGDITRRHKVGPLETDIRHGGHAHRVMDSYEKWFGDGPEVALLSVLGLFTRPAPPAALAVIRKKPVIEGLTEPFARLAKPQWRQLLARLRRARLLAKPDPENPEFLDTHPLIREHFGQKLQEEHPEAWQEANSRLFEYYTRTAKELPDTVEEMDPLFQAMVCACRAGRETDAFRDVYIKRIMRGDEYYAGFELETLSPLLSVLSQFFEDGEWTMPYEADPPNRQGLSIGDQLTVLTHAGWFLTATQSYAAPDVGEVFSFAETLCSDDDERFPVLRGLWVYKLIRAELDDADRRSRQLLEIAEQKNTSQLLVEAHMAMGLTGIYRGEFERSREHLLKSQDLYDSKAHRLNSFIYGNDPGVSALAFDGFALWLLGYPDQAMARCQEAHILAEEVGHAFSITLTLYMYAMLYQARGDVENTKKFSDHLVDFCTRQGSRHFLTHGRIFSGWANFKITRDADSVERMLLGLKEHLDTGAIVTHTYHIALLADALAEIGDHERGLSILEDGIDMINTHGDRRWAADLHRVKGDLLATKSAPDVEAAIQAYSQSLEIAREQAAKSFELRTTIGLSRLLAKEGRDDEAVTQLWEVYSWFKEGHTTSDLCEAAALLRDLGQEVPDPILSKS
jgi:predicted ATPase